MAKHNRPTLPPEVEKLRYDVEDLRTQLAEAKRENALLRSKLDELSGVNGAANDVATAFADLRVRYADAIALVKDIDRVLTNRTMGIASDDALLARVHHGKAKVLA